MIASNAPDAIYTWNPHIRRKRVPTAVLLSVQSRSRNPLLSASDIRPQRRTRRAVRCGVCRYGCVSTASRLIARRLHPSNQRFRPPHASYQETVYLHSFTCLHWPHNLVSTILYHHRSALPDSNSVYTDSCSPKQSSHLI